MPNSWPSNLQGFITTAPDRPTGNYHSATQWINLWEQEPGSAWYDPNKGGSLFTPRSVATGLEAHIAAGKVGSISLRAGDHSDISTPVRALLFTLVSIFKPYIYPTQNT